MRCASPLLLALPLAASLGGCGGSGRSTPAPAAESLGLSPLGASAMDVQLAGGGTALKSAGMVATGKADGFMGGYSTGQASSGCLFLEGTLRRRMADGQSFVQQTVSVQIIHRAALAVGASFDLQDSVDACNAEYDEGHGVPYGGDWSSLPTDRWMCVGGTAEVTSLDGGEVGVRLTNVTLRLAGTDPIEPTLTLSGTLSATVKEM